MTESPTQPQVPSLASYPLPTPTPEMFPAVPDMFDRLRDDSFRSVPGTEAAVVRELRCVRDMTGGEVAATVTRLAPSSEWVATPWHMNTNAQLAYVTRGWIDFEFEGLGVVRLEAGGSMLLPALCRHRETAVSHDYELIQVMLPGTFAATIWMLDPKSGTYEEKVLEDVGAALFRNADRQGENAVAISD